MGIPFVPIVFVQRGGWKNYCLEKVTTFFDSRGYRKYWRMIPDYVYPFRGGPKS